MAVGMLITYSSQVLQYGLVWLCLLQNISCRINDIIDLNSFPPQHHQPNEQQSFEVKGGRYLRYDLS